jgi:hypothetical protein
MHPLILCLGLLVLAVVSACDGEPTSETSSVLPCESSTQASSDPPEPSSSARCVTGTGAGGQTGGASGAVPGGGPAGSITRSWSESVTQSGDGTSSTITQRYAATVDLSLTKVDEGAWTVTGTASIESTYTSDWVSRQTSSLGPCNVHYTDDAAASGTVAVEGGLEARDGFYNFYVNIPGLDGSNDTVRDDSGCNGPNNQERTPWSVAPITASGSGDMTSPRAISGSTSTPRGGGEDTLTWSFSLPE